MTIFSFGFLFCNNSNHRKVTRTIQRTPIPPLLRFTGFEHSLSDPPPRFLSYFYEHLRLGCILLYNRIVTRFNKLDIEARVSSNHILISAIVPIGSFIAFFVCLGCFGYSIRCKVTRCMQQCVSLGLSDVSLWLDSGHAAWARILLSGCVLLSESMPPLWDHGCQIFEFF